MARGSLHHGPCLQLLTATAFIHQHSKHQAQLERDLTQERWAESAAPSITKRQSGGGTTILRRPALPVLCYVLPSFSTPVRVVVPAFLSPCPGRTCCAEAPHHTTLTYPMFPTNCPPLRDGRIQTVTPQHTTMATSTTPFSQPPKPQGSQPV